MSENKKKPTLWDPQGKIKVACDGVVIYDNSHILMIKRSSKSTAYPGQWALPGGGFEDEDESLESCVIREVKEETGIRVWINKFLFHMDKKDRDPRFRAITCVWLCNTVQVGPERLKAGDDADEVKLIKLKEVLKLDLAFDHWDIIFRVIESGAYKD